jgi:hypothetical protein
VHNIECQKHLKDFLPLTNKISELENQRRSILSATIEDFINIKSHIFRPLQKAHFKEHFYRECLIKSKRLQSSDISKKIMSLSDFDAPKHPSEFIPVRYLPYEILKIERKNLSSSKLFDKYDSVLSGFDAVESEEIDSKQRMLVSKVVDEITSVRSREVRKQIFNDEKELIQVRLLMISYLRKMMQERNFY